VSEPIAVQALVVVVFVAVMPSVAIWRFRRA
jgi:hypothetical protein